MDTTQLVAQARAAYEQKRIRECIALTKALALADPENEDAQALQSAIQADVQRDLGDARALLEQFGSKDEEKKYRKAAEIILIKTLHLDSENEEAKALLQSARALPALPALPNVRPAPNSAEEIPFTVVPPVFASKEKKRTRRKLPFALIAIVVLAGGLVQILRSRPTSPNALAARVERTEPANQTDFSPAWANTRPSTSPAVQAVYTAPLAAGQTTVAAPALPSAAAPLTSIVTTPITVTAAADMGKLAVSSPTAAEIYMGDRYLGSTPTTLQLPVGRQKLEYRHGDLRTVVTHDIRVNEMTTASISFQITVQINARPWAQVSLDGTTRRPLGQTPVSDVTVPIGGVLLFENPNFTSKSYRITEKDTAIQVNFP